MYYDLPPDKPIVIIDRTFLKTAKKHAASNDPFKQSAQNTEGFGGFLSYSGTANASLVSQNVSLSYVLEFTPEAGPIPRVEMAKQQFDFNSKLVEYRKKKVNRG